MIELSRTQDEEVGDGTTSVIILGSFSLVSFFYRLFTLFRSSASPAGEVLSLAQPLLQRNMHPRVIVGAYMRHVLFFSFLVHSC
jgi:T-complex protein 1 subunit gamma